MRGDIANSAADSERDHSDRQQTRQMRPPARGVVARIEDLGVMRPVRLARVIRSARHGMRLLARGQARLLMLTRHHIRQRWSRA
jgi:hypothetical protein